MNLDQIILQRSQYKKIGKSKISQSVLDKFNPNLRYDNGSNGNIINIFGVIGDEWLYDAGEMHYSGITSSYIAQRLRDIGSDKDVEININSPGGDAFEGLAIYNLLKMHKGKVTVNIIALAASAASIIAMAADDLKIDKSAFIMIHNAWTFAYGNKNDLLSVADFLDKVDNAASEIYSERSGVDQGETYEMMNNETWISGNEAVEKGFADSFLDNKVYEKSESDTNKIFDIIDKALASSGMTRSNRRELIKDLKSSMLDATKQADDSTLGAAFDIEPLPKINFNFKLED